MTQKWKLGADLIAASDQIFFGDEANLSRPLAGYAKVNLHTSYDITDHVQVYGHVRESDWTTDYSIYGTYFSVEDAKRADTSYWRRLQRERPRTVVPAIPFAAYGGLKVKF